MILCTHMLAITMMHTPLTDTPRHIKHMHARTRDGNIFHRFTLAL
jgi:hypothetical protein